MKKVIGSLVVLLVLGACATQKSKSDQSGFSRFYHNQTSRFNGYFNANELVIESIAQLEAQQQDNYNDLLPVYEYRDAKNPSAVASNLDEAIKKVSIVATIHDNSDYLDDCYLLIGKAEYLKQDFESAENALEFFMDEFEPDGKRSSTASAKRAKKKKKNSSKKDREKSADQRAKELEKERKAYNKALKKKQKRSAKGKSTADIIVPETSTGNVASKRSTTRATAPPPEQEVKEKDPQAKAQNPGGVKHRPAYQEAQLWLAKTYVERENYPRAEYHFNSLSDNPYLQPEVAKELPAAQAYYHIHRGNYKGAIPHLEQAIEVTRQKTVRARYAYILGQIYEMEDDGSAKPYEYFEMALDLNPNYEMAFNSRLSMARTAYLSGQASLDESIATLDRMVKDEKNEEYLDKLYFTYARVNLFQGNKDLAIKNLIMSAQAGGSGPQLTETNFLLATLYFEKDMYIEAKQAYDATLQTMPEDDERYELTKIMADNLSDIAENLKIIALQDSLLRISGMSPDEQKALAKNLKKQEKQGYTSSSQGITDNAPTKGKGKGTKSDQLASSALTAGGPPVRSVVNTGQSSFFAYDDRAIRRGERDFIREWGNRPLVDNWRLSSVMSNYTVRDDDTGEEVVVESDELDDDELAKILKDVPKTPEEIALAESTKQQAMLKLGALYRDKLESPELSVKVLEQLIGEYPNSDASLEAFYQLYISYTALGNNERAEYYKQKIISNFPGTKYAMALSDPDYINRQLSEERKVEVHYEEVYDLVEAGQYQQARDAINAGRVTFGTSHAYMAKIAILDAMITGNLEGKEKYVDALKSIVANYPDTEEETKARDMLLLLGEYKNKNLNLQKSSTAGGYRNQPNSVHYLLVVINNFEEVNTRDAKISISDYNRKYHKLDRLKISSLVFDPKTGQSVILVRSFKNSVEAMKYFDNVQRHTAEFLPEGAEFEVFPVSQFNYREVIKSRSIEGYRVFFEENYSD